MTSDYEGIATAFSDAAGGRSLWETAMQQNVPAAAYLEVALIFAALAARASNTMPRAVCESLFKEAPDDEEWAWRYLPLLDSIARGGD